MGCDSISKRSKLPPVGAACPDATTRRRLGAAGAVSLALGGGGAKIAQSTPPHSPRTASAAINRRAPALVSSGVGTHRPLSIFQHARFERRNVVAQHFDIGLRALAWL